MKVTLDFDLEGVANDFAAFLGAALAGEIKQIRSNDHEEVLDKRATKDRAQKAVIMSGQSMPDSAQERAKERERLYPRLIPVNQWNKFHPMPKMGGLRALIFHADTNGFGKCIRRIGRSVHIREDLFFEWVEEQNKARKN